MVGETPTKTLSAEHREFNLCDIQPTPKPDSNTGAPTQTLPAVSTRAHGFQPLRVTEYMVRNMVPGMGTFPQWIELYNPNSVDINIAGWHLTTVSFKKRCKVFDDTNDQQLG